MTDKHWRSNGTIGLRTLQFIFTITAAGLYGADLHHATATHTRANSASIYAEIGVFLSVSFFILQYFTTLWHVGWYALDFVFVILWAAVTGVFGRFISVAANHLMKAAVWIDLVNMLLCCATMVLGCVACVSARRVTKCVDVPTGAPADVPADVPTDLEMGEEKGKFWSRRRANLLAFQIARRPNTMDSKLRYWYEVLNQDTVLKLAM